METYTLRIGDIERKLPIVAVSEELSIASFVILGDTELVSYTAPILASKLPEVDVLVTAEAKGIPLVYELSKQLGMKQYVVARKSIKPYMESPLINEVVSITTQKKQILCLDSDDVQQIKGKRVAIIDDVISTGQSVRGLEELVIQAGGIVAAKAAILAEGNAAEREDIVFLEKLPLFRK
ncbi:MAG TPA: adenine phosphoribosyltransferase [Bacillus bacterium]|uniref:Adenine phosphoribosyltransferase n=1 Tax=Siminovitchia fordii TaxID=254759 RepID=A0ABQ4K307_9BACI|nr:phosphoribosyltransferase family protein [Siminovitchia fordii]GIN20146.1 adenine phosphoribosyltransferase [Siminovitchia fordii]HBZ09222.1 adenine phosphoribosyltransferase [Bacillus sp. (in: firmicutes)]